METDIWLEDFVTKLLDLAGLDLAIVELNVSDKDDTFVVQLDGPDKARAIGRDGLALEAIQHLVVSAAANAGISQDRIVIDVDGYRERRDAKVRDDAQRLAEETLETMTPHDLAPMSPRERRLVHMVISEMEGITTQSVGKGEERFVRLIPKRTPAAP
jgi:spoIIIJ-associated protein